MKHPNNQFKYQKQCKNNINSVSGGSKVNNTNNVNIVKSVQAVYSAVLPPSLMAVYLLEAS